MDKKQAQDIFFDGALLYAEGNDIDNVNQALDILLSQHNLVRGVISNNHLLFFSNIIKEAPEASVTHSSAPSFSRSMTAPMKQHSRPKSLKEGEHFSNIIKDISLSEKISVENTEINGPLFIFNVQTEKEIIWLATFRNTDRINWIQMLEQTISGKHDKMSRWQIPPSDIQVFSEIGSGAFGSVFKSRLWGTDVVAKVLKSFSENFDDLVEQINMLKSEIAILSQLRHPNCLLYIGAVTQPPDVMIVTELCEKGSLDDLLHDNVDYFLTIDRIMTFAHEVAQGLNYLHQQNPPIIHRDLKAENILVSSAYSLKIADFGLSKVRSSMLEDFVGTPQWMAPEVINGYAYSEKVDVYAFGILLCELYSRRPTYQEHNFKDFISIFQFVRDENGRPTIPDWVPFPMRHLAQKCMQEFPKDRPNFSQITKQLRMWNHTYLNCFEDTEIQRLKYLLNQQNNSNLLVLACNEITANESDLKHYSLCQVHEKLRNWFFDRLICFLSGKVKIVSHKADVHYAVLKALSSWLRRLRHEANIALEMADGQYAQRKQKIYTDSIKYVIDNLLLEEIFKILQSEDEKRKKKDKKAHIKKNSLRQNVPAFTKNREEKTKKALQKKGLRSEPGKSLIDVCTAHMKSNFADMKKTKKNETPSEIEAYRILNEVITHVRKPEEQLIHFQGEALDIAKNIVEERLYDMEKEKERMDAQRIRTKRILEFLSAKQETAKRSLIETTTTTTKTDGIKVLSIGTIVKLKGLVKAPQYNGKIATILSLYNHATEKYHIKINDTGKDFNIKATFLTHVNLDGLCDPTMFLLKRNASTEQCRSLSSLICPYMDDIISDGLVHVIINYCRPLGPWDTISTIISVAQLVGVQFNIKHTNPDWEFKLRGEMISTSDGWTNGLLVLSHKDYPDQKSVCSLHTSKRNYLTLWGKLEDKEKKKPMDIAVLPPGEELVVFEGFSHGHVHYDKMGKYISDRNDQYGKPIFTQLNGPYSLWWSPDCHWKLGDKEDTGTGICYISTHNETDVDSPAKYYGYWTVFTNGKWKQAGELACREMGAYINDEKVEIGRNDVYKVSEKLSAPKSLPGKLRKRRSINLANQEKNISIT